MTTLGAEEDSDSIELSPIRLRIGERLESLNDARVRRRLYAVVAAGLLLVCMMLGVVKWRFSHKEPRLDFAGSDGKYYYLYVSSLIVDGDLDFKNQMREQWPEEDYPLTETGGVLNKYPIGLSLTLLPSFVPAHGLSLLVHAITHKHFFAANGYTVFYQILNLSWVFVLCWATFALLDRVMAQHLGIQGKYVALGVLFAWVGSQYLYHAVRFPLMSNVISTFWVMSAIAAAAEAVQAARQNRFVAWHWPVLVFCTSMAIVTRPTDVMVSIFGFFALYQLARQGMLPRLVRVIPWLALALLPILLQMITWHAMFGRWVTYSYGGRTFKSGGTEKFYWTDPVLFKSLFSPRAGLFEWCPIVAIGTFAAVFFLFRFRLHKNPATWLLGCFVAAFIVLWYFDSAWWCWPFGSYPGRAYVEMVGLPALGIALLFHYTESNLRARRIVVGLLLVSLASTYFLEAAFDLALVPRYGDTVILLGPKNAKLVR